MISVFESTLWMSWWEPKLQGYAMHGVKGVLAGGVGEGAEMPIDGGGISRAAHVAT